jgi:hypothetical protein
MFPPVHPNPVLISLKLKVIGVHGSDGLAVISLKALRSSQGTLTKLGVPEKLGP